jgi:hypothetical protein
MFLQLGQTETGSRALGSEFVEYAFIAQKAVAQWFVDIFNEHVIEDLIDWNYGEQVDQVPLLTYIVEDQNEYLSVTELTQMVKENIITVDEELEDTLRERYHLGKRTGPRPTPAELNPAPVAPPTSSPAPTDAPVGAK